MLFCNELLHDCCSSPDHMYYYDGKDYSKVPSTEDEKRFDLMMMESSAILEDDGKEGRVLRTKGSVSHPVFFKCSKSKKHTFI